MTKNNDIAENLPELERQVFAAVRAGQERVGVHEVLQQLTKQDRPLAYTTVMTVLTRLWQKGYLERQAEGRAYAYRARPAEDIAGDLGGRVARDAIAKFGPPALTGFVKTLSPEQRALVARLLADNPDQDPETKP
ncbi:MAG: BlaI/MecI/CopY family transcriptional regulator [Tepidiformaceae bacterium]